MDFKSFNQRIFKKFRVIIYSISLTLLIILFIISFSKGKINTVSLANNLGYLAFIYLSLALSVTPIRKIFPEFPFNQSFANGRRAMGVSAFVFAFFHINLHFFFTFSGSQEALIKFSVANRYGILSGLIAFFILFAMALTSTDWAVKKLGRKWFRLHRLVYIAYPLIIWHAINVGRDFKIINTFSGIFLMIVGITIILELWRVLKGFKS